jgi:hypothetical protein
MIGGTMSRPALPLLALASLPFAALAEPPPATSKPAPTATTPTKKSASADGSLAPKDKLHGEANGSFKPMVNVKSPDDKPIDIGSHIESAPHAYAGGPAHGNAPSADNDLVMELVNKQMRRYKVAIDKCKQNATKAAPDLAGTVVLAIKVVDHKVTSSSVKADTMNNAKLDECLLQSSRKWTFGVPQADFTWEVDVESDKPSL